MSITDPFAADTGTMSDGTDLTDPFAGPLTIGFDPATGAPATKPTLGQKVKAVAKAAPEIAKQVAVGTVPFAVPAAAEAAAHALPTLGAAAAKKIPFAGQAGFLAGTAVKAIEDQVTINRLSKTRDAIEPVDLAATTQRFYDSLLPGLTAKGWTPEHVMTEARQRARNVMLGAQATKESIDQQVEQTQRDVLGLPGEAVTNALFLGISPRVLGAMGSGILKAAGEGAAKAGVKTALAPATAAATRVIGSLAKHAAIGGIVGAVGIGSGRSVDRGLEAWAATKPTDEIAKEMVSGAREGAAQGGAVGSVIGATLGAPLEAVARAGASRAAVKAASLEAEARDLIERNATAVRLRNAAIDQTAVSFDPHQARVPLDADPIEMATTLIQQAHGEDAAMSEAGLRAATRLADRLKLYQDANTVLEGNITPRPAGIGEGVLPVGAPITPEGGPGVQPNALPGPMGDQFPSLIPPNPLPAAPEGLTGTPAPEPPPTLSPGDVQSELPARVVQPLPAVPPQTLPSEAVKPMPSVEGKDLVQHAIDDAIAAADHGKALRLVEKYQMPMPRGLARAAVNDLIAEGDHEGALKLAEKTGLRTAPEPKNAATSGKPKVSTPKESLPAEVSAPKPVAEVQNVDTSTQVSTVSHDPFADIVKATPAVPAVAPTSPVAEAASKLTELTHATVSPTSDGKGLTISLGVKPGEVAKPGGPATALDQIVRTADQHGVRVETDLVPAAVPKGGKIPLEKLIPWYEARGFKVVSSTKIPEGKLATAKLVREPIGIHQNQVATALEKVAKEADARLTKKLGRMNSGFDITMIGDASLRLAADMVSRKLRAGDELASHLVQLYGDTVKPFIAKIVAAARKHIAHSREADAMTKTMIKLGGEFISPKVVEGDFGNSRSASYWITPDGKLISVPEMHGRNATKVLKALKIKADPGYEGASYGAGSEAQTLLNRGFIRAQASGSMIAFDLSRGINDAQRALLKRAIGAHEDWAAAVSNSKGELMKGFSSSKGHKAHHFLAAATQHE